MLNLPHQLIPRKPRCNRGEIRPTLAARVADRVTVAALRELKLECALQFKRSSVGDKRDVGRRRSPRLHLRTPRRTNAEQSKHGKSRGQQHNQKHRDRPARWSALAAIGKKRHRGKNRNRHWRSDQQQKCFACGWKQRERGEEPEEECIGSRRSFDDARIRKRARPERPEPCSNANQNKQHCAAKHHVVARRVGIEGHAVLLHARLVAFAISRRINRLASLRHFTDAVAQHRVEMAADERDCRTRQNEHMQREEARERCAGNHWTAQQERAQLIADAGRAVRNRRADAETPIRIGIPTHDLPREREAQRGQAEEHARNPSEFAGKLVGAVEKHLRKMDEHHDAHRIRTPTVERAQHPAKRNLFVDVHEAFVGLRRAGRVDRGQHNAARDLNREEHHGRAAEHIPPLGVARHAMEHRLAEHPQDAGAVIEPAQTVECRALDHEGGLHFLLRHASSCRPGRRPAKISRFSSAMRHWYSKSPRGGGPDAREPSS